MSSLSPYTIWPNLKEVNHRASDDIPSPDKVRSILKDLREARQSKSREGMEVIDAVHVEVSSSLSNALQAKVVLTDDKHIGNGAE